MHMITKTLPLSTAHNMRDQLVNLGAKVKTIGSTQTISAKPGVVFKIEGDAGNVEVSWAIGLFDEVAT